MPRRTSRSIVARGIPAASAISASRQGPLPRRERSVAWRFLSRVWSTLADGLLAASQGGLSFFTVASPCGADLRRSIHRHGEAKGAGTEDDLRGSSRRQVHEASHLASIPGAAHEFCLWRPPTTMIGRCQERATALLACHICGRQRAHPRACSRHQEPGSSVLRAMVSRHRRSPRRCAMERRERLDR